MAASRTFMDFRSDSLDYQPEFLPRDEASRFLEALWTGLEWSQKEIVLFGRRVMQPRLTAWYGDTGVTYRYSGLTLHPLAWHPVLLEIRERIESFTDQRFNAVLANAYRDGSDSMGWHRDDEAELGRQPVIASVSLGDERRFLVRENQGPPSALVLEHGSLLVMKGDFQRRYRHALPKTRRQAGLRINLTYRLVGSQARV